MVEGDGHDGVPGVALHMRGEGWWGEGGYGEGVARVGKR